VILSFLLFSGDRVIFAESPSAPGVPIVYRLPEERQANPDRLNLDRYMHLITSRETAGILCWTWAHFVGPLSRLLQLPLKSQRGQAIQ